MAYTPNEWGVGNLITASKMNKIERQLVVNTSDLDDIRNGVTVPTYEEFEDLVNNTVYVNEAQTLSTAQKDQARDNIEAASEEDVTSLKSALEAVSGNSVIPFTSGGYIQLNTGVANVNSPNQNANYRYAVVPCNAGDVFNVSATGANAGRAWGFISSAGTVLSMAEASITVSNLRLVAPQNAAYLVINDNNTGAISYTDDLLVNRVNENTAFQNNIIDNGINPEQTSFCEPTESDESDINILENVVIYPGYITATNGVRTQNANYQTTGWMDVVPGSTYKIDLSAGATQVLAVWFDADGVTGTQVNLGFVSGNTKTVNAVCPNEKKKLVLNVNSSNAVTAPTGVYNLSPVLSYDKFTIPDLVVSVDKPLSGKTICNFGDSLFGQARPPYDVSTKLAELTGATVHNCGFGGCQMGVYSDNAKYDAFSMYRLADAIATGDWTYQDDGISAGGLPAYFAETLALLKTLDWTKIDIITISYGTNDFTNGLQPRITNNPDSGNNKYKAVGTALQYSIETILNAYPNIRIFVCLPMYRVWLTANNEFDYDSNTATHTSWVGSPDGAEHTFIEFVEAERTVAKANQLPVIDNYYDLCINRYNWREYFPANDGTHHNQTGRNLIAKHMAHILW